MTLDVRPVLRLQGRIHLPASKSYSIRAYIIAARGGVSQIKHPSDCEDAIVASQVARKLNDHPTSRGWEKFSVGESGTTLRFLLPLLALYIHKAKVVGRGTLVGRPNNHLCETLRRQGMDIKGSGKKESVPIVFNGGLLRGGK